MSSILQQKNDDLTQLSAFLLYIHKNKSKPLPGAVEAFNQFFKFIDTLDPNQLISVTKKLDLSIITLEIMDSVTQTLAAQIFSDYQNTYNNKAKANVPLYTAMAKYSIIYQIFKSNWVKLVPLSNTIPVSRIYADFFPLSEIEQAQPNQIRKRLTPFLNNFLKTHPNPEVRKISNIPVRKFDNSNEFEIDRGLLNKIDAFISENRNAK